MKTTRNALIVGIMLIVLSLVAVMPAAAQGPNEFDDWSFIEFVDCANDGAGEWVELSGTIHFGDGGEGLQVNLQNAKGIGQTTGDVYRAIGAAQWIWIDKNETEIFGIVDNFKLVGPGPDNNLTIREVFRVTANANGEVTAVVDSYSVECR